MIRPDLFELMKSQALGSLGNSINQPPTGLPVQLASNEPSPVWGNATEAAYHEATGQYSTGDVDRGQPKPQIVPTESPDQYINKAREAEMLARVKKQKEDYLRNQESQRNIKRRVYSDH